MISKFYILRYLTHKEMNETIKNVFENDLKKKSKWIL